MKIRIGNDFVFNWAIERGGLPEDLSSVLDAKLTVSVFGKKQNIPFTISGNIITIEFTPEICNIIGLYNLLFTYILPDTSLSDEDRKCAVDVDAFQIVAKTAQADDSTEFSMTSDMAIAFKGDKGDRGDKGDKGDSAYQVWLDAGNIGTEEDYFAYLRQPAIDAAQSANEAADSAVTATQEATTAASLADTARLAIQDDLALKANHGYVLGEEEIKTLKQVETDTSIKIENVLIGGSFEDDSNGDGIADGGIVIVSPNPNRDTIHLLTNDCIIGSKAQKFVGGVGGGAPFLKLKDVDSVTDKYYYSFWTKSTVAGGFWRVSNGDNRNNIPTSQNVYRRDSIVLNNLNILSVNMGFYSTSAFGPLPEGEEVYIDGFMQINLTKTFGVGNEPTKEEMDLLISTLGIDYFEGEITIPAQKIMQWQLALIRKNKNAILALGGTII